MLPRTNRKLFGQNGRGYLLLPQQFQQFSVPALNKTSIEGSNIKSFAKNSSDFANRKQSNALASKKELVVLKNNLVLWSKICYITSGPLTKEQVLTDSTTKAQKWDWIYKT